MGTAQVGSSLQLCLKYSQLVHPGTEEARSVEAANANERLAFDKRYEHHDLPIEFWLVILEMRVGAASP